jgi:hypothetical protein
LAIYGEEVGEGESTLKRSSFIGWQANVHDLKKLGITEGASFRERNNKRITYVIAGSEPTHM